MGCLTKESNPPKKRSFVKAQKELVILYFSTQHIEQRRKARSGGGGVFYMKKFKRDGDMIASASDMIYKVYLLTC